MEGSGPGGQRDAGRISDAKYSRSPRAVKFKGGKNLPGTVTGKVSPLNKRLALVPKRFRWLLGGRASPAHVGPAGSERGGGNCFAQDRVWVRAQKYLHVAVYKSWKQEAQT